MLLLEIWPLVLDTVRIANRLAHSLRHGLDFEPLCFQGPLPHQSSAARLNLLPRTACVNRSKSAMTAQDHAVCSKLYAL